MKRLPSLLILIVVGASLLGFARWLSGEGEAQALAAAPAAPHAAAAPPPRTERAAEVLDASAVTTRAVTEEKRHESDPAAAGESATTARAARTLLVLDARSGLPVEGARVRYSAMAPGAAPTTHLGWNADTCDAWLRADGPSAQTDAQGEVELDTQPGRACIAVIQHGELIGREQFEGDEEGRKTVELGPDDSVEALVIGSNGAPLVSAAVALRRRVQGWSEDRRTLRTDEDGRVRFAHIGLDLEPADSALWSVALVGLVDASAEVRIELNDLPHEALVLRTGASGVVEVAVNGLDGRALESGVAELQVDDGRGDAPRSFWRRPEHARVPLAQGLARFERVRLGESLWVVVEPFGAPAPARQRIQGPRAPDERVRVEVRLGDEQPLLVLRLLDELGAPLAELSVAWRIQVESDFSLTSKSGQLRTDRDGVLVLALGEPWVEGVRRTLHLALDDSAPAPPAAKLDLSRDYTPGRHELGDLTLRLPPVVAAGRVLAASGAAVGGALVHVTELNSEGEREWTALDTEVECDAGGAFVVRGDAASERIRVRARTPTAHSAEQDVARGAANLQLTLVEGGSLAGRLLLDATSAADALTIVLTRQEQHANSSHVELERNGVFKSENLAPGMWRLEVRAAGTHQAFATLDELLVPSGAPCSDPRLESIDLRGQLTTIRLELVPPRPNERVLGVVVVTPKSPTGEPFERMLQDRRVDLAVAAGSVDLRVETTGFRTVHRTDVRGDQRIELERGPPVRLRVPLGAELPKPPYHLKPFLKRVGSASTMVGHFQDATLGADREVLLYAPGAGEFEVEWILEKRLESSLTTSPLTVPEPQRVQVLDSDAEQVIDLVLPTEAIAEALQRGL